MKNSETKEFVAYEYLSINVVSDKEALYIDCYENFGWMITNSINNGLVDKEDYYLNNSNINGKKLINLKFKRDRKIANKSKLISLQTKCENGFKELEKLEKEPNIVSGIYAIVISVIGTIFLAISLFSITAKEPLWVLGIIMGIIGLFFWILTYPVYKQIKTKYEKNNVSLIEEQYNTIYDSCEQARKLID